MKTLCSCGASDRCRWRRASPWRSASSIPIPRSTGRPKRSTTAPANWTTWPCSTLIASTPTCSSCIAASFSRRAASAPTSTISARRCSSSSMARRNSRSTGALPLLKGPAGAPCRMGHSHGIYNPTDKPVQWMNINVSAMKGTYDAFNLGDPRVDVPLDPDPGVHDHAAGPRAASARERDERRQGRGAIPARAGSLGVHQSRGPMWITWCFRPALRPGRTCIGRWRSSIT